VCEDRVGAVARHDEVLVAIVDLDRLGRSEERRAHHATVGAGHERGSQRAAVSDASGGEHRNRRVTVHDRREQRQQAHVARVTTGLGPLCNQHVDTRVDGLCGALEVLHLTDDLGVGVACAARKKGSTYSRNGVMNPIANGRSVASRTIATCSAIQLASRSVCIPPNDPRPPACETAAARTPPLCIAIGADITGDARSNSSVKRVRSTRST
jgi:hypothetical protein